METIKKKENTSKFMLFYFREQVRFYTLTRKIVSPVLNYRNINHLKDKSIK